MISCFYHQVPYHESLKPYLQIQGKGYILRLEHNHFDNLDYNFQMSSHQIEINSMLLRLKEWNKQLGGNLAKKIEGNEFDFIQEEFLSTRYRVDKAQDQREKDGYTTHNAGIGVEIREGLSKMKELLDQLKQQHRKLTKKKKDTPDILERKQKIIENCQLLLKDLEDREEDGAPKKQQNAVTLTEMKAKLLEEIQEHNDYVHHKNDSDGKLTENLEEDKAQIAKWKKKDEELDIIVDDIILGARGLKKKVKDINQAQEVINQKTGKTGKKVDKLSKRIQGDNQKLKKIIQDFKPNRCCLYVALFLLLVGLIVCVIKLLI